MDRHHIVGRYVTVECDGLSARIEALAKLLDEREDRTKERFASMKIAVDAALAAADRAVTKAEIATEKRFESVNEFRDTLRDQSNTLLPRLEYNVQHTALVEVVNNLVERLTTLESRLAAITITNSENRVIQTDSSARLFSIIAIVVAAAVGVGQVFTGLTNHSLAAQQVELATHVAHNPVEGKDLDLLNSRLDSLSRRLDDAGNRK